MQSINTVPTELSQNMITYLLRIIVSQPLSEMMTDSLDDK